MPEKITADMREAAKKQVEMLSKQIIWTKNKYTIERVVDAYNDGRIIIPSADFRNGWKLEEKESFLEKIILGKPVFAFVLEKNDELDDAYTIRNGSQRLLILVAFMNGVTRLKNLKRATTLNGFKFTDLPESCQKDFRNREVVTIIKDTSPEMD